MMRVPHPITPADIMDIVPQINDAERMKVWNVEAKSLVETRTMKIQWEESKLPTSVDLGILGSFDTMVFMFNHTANTCNAR